MKFDENWWKSMKIGVGAQGVAGSCIRGRIQTPVVCLYCHIPYTVPYIVYGHYTPSGSLYLGTIPRRVVCIWATIPRPGFVFGIQYPVLGLYLGYNTGSGVCADLNQGLAGSAGRIFWVFYWFWWFFIDFGDYAAVERQVRASIYIYLCM